MSRGGKRNSRDQRSVTGLSSHTRSLLSRGAGYWANGPAHVSNDLAQLMDLGSAREAGQLLERVGRALDDDHPVNAVDLTRVLFLTELGICSSVFGPGDWHSVYGGGRDYHAFMQTEFSVLMDVQDELGTLGVPGTDPFHRGRVTAT